MFLNVIDESILPLIASQRRGAKIVTSQAFRKAVFFALRTSVSCTCKETVVTRTEEGPEELDLALAPTFVAVMARVFSEGVLPNMLCRSVAEAYFSSSESACVLERLHLLPLELFSGVFPAPNFQVEGLLQN